MKINGIPSGYELQNPYNLQKTGASDLKLSGQKSSDGTCDTCDSRRYQDGSDEMVSFKSSAHISPESAPSMVRAHEQEHVTNAYSDAAMNNGEVVSANVAIHTSICPECGRTYVSGGTTSTQIKYFNETNPYQQDKKMTDGLDYRGMNINEAC